MSGLTPEYARLLMTLAARPEFFDMLHGRRQGSRFFSRAATICSVICLRISALLATALISLCEEKDRGAADRGRGTF